MALKLGIGKKGKLVDTTSGIVGDAAQGLGIGTIWNVADKRLLSGRLTAMGVSIGQTLNGKPLCLNVTDALTYASVVGLKSPLAKGNLIKGAVAVGIKKVFEAFDYIDPPNPVFTQPANAPLSVSSPTNGGMVH